jgi:conjugative relaxase-like TrwC/TraI family protein
VGPVLSFAMRSDWRYLTRHTKDAREPGDDDARSRDDAERDREQEYRDRDDEHRARDYYTAGAERGEPAGTWWGSGAESLGLRGDVTEDVMEQLYGELVNPNTGEALGTRPREYATYEDRLAALLAKEPDATPERVAELELAAHKSHREARHYADLTFSPPKSWSVLHAALEHAGRHDEAAAVWDAWEAGVHAGLQYLMDEAGYSRAGYHGAQVAGRTSGRWVDAHDYVVSLWRHHTSRDGDPQLHIHAAVPNRVRCDDGAWRSLDSNAISAARPAAGAISERVAEEALTAALGVQFLTRPDGKAREVAGISEEVRELFSSRRRAITPGVAELAEAYEAKHGREPSPYVLRLMAEHVTLKTRARKPDQSPSREELLTGWEQSMRERLGRSFDDVLEAVALDPEREPQPERFTPEHVIKQAVADIEATKAVWNRHDLVAGIIRHLPEQLGGLTGEQVRTLVDDLADHALTNAVDRDVITLTVPELIPVPDELRRADGRSQFEPHRPDRYATAAQLEREDSVLAAARQAGAPQASDERIEELLLPTELGVDQREAVREILGSGKRLEVLVGPAGTGKSYTVGTLVELWEEAFGTDVFGVAVSQNAVDVLRDEGIPRGANVSQFLAWHDKLAHGKIDERFRDQYALRPGQLLVIDEASTISTVELTKVVQIATDAGAKVLVTGDPNQLGAVGVGGAMQLLVDQVGAVRLSEVRRFANEWEREASLQIREGDTAALLEYDRHGRLVGGSKERMTELALDGFLGDHLAGKRSVLIVDDNERAAELSSRVRQELAGLGLVERDGVELHDGTLAGAGDLIQTRRNEYRLVDPDTGHSFIVVNREIWKVEGREPDGGLVVRRELDRGRDGEQRWSVQRHLPAWYVQEHVELAYASTVHAVEGLTVDTGHAVVGARTNLAAFYVELTRGGESNVAYVITVSPDQHYLARLSEMFERPPVERAATHVQGEEFDAVDHLGRLGPVWTQLVADDAGERYRTALCSTLGNERGARTAADPASGALYRLLRTAELDGHDVPALLAEVASQRELDSAESVAQVLHHRIGIQLAQARPVGEERQAEEFVSRSYSSRTPVTMSLPTAVSGYVRDVARAMDERAAHLAVEAATTAPSWAERLGPAPEDPLARMEWTERAAAVAAYREHFGFDSEREAIGPRPGEGSPERRAAWEQAADALNIRGTEREMARHTEGELRNLIDAYTREEAWLPPNVNDRLRTATIAARESEGSAARLRAQLEATGRHAEERAEITEKLARADALAVRMRDRATTLDEIAHVRSAAVASVADVYAEAHAAREELRHRGIDPETAGRRATEHEPAASGANGQRTEPERAAERSEEVRDRAAEAGRRVFTERNAERPAREHDVAGREPSRDHAGAVEEVDESARLAADLATAREAADRLAARHEAMAERVADHDVDAALRAVRGERSGEQQEANAERADLDMDAALRAVRGERSGERQEAEAERVADLDMDAALRALRGPRIPEQQRPPPERDQGIEMGGP